MTSIEQKTPKTKTYTERARTYKPFSRNHRLLYDEEITRAVEKIIASYPIYYSFTSSSLIEFVNMITDAQDDLLLNLAGIINNLGTHFVVVLNTYNPLLNEDEDEDEDNMLHFVLLILNSQTRKGLLVDPLPSNEDNTSLAENVILLSTALNEQVNSIGVENYKIESICLGVQEDNYNCGIYCLMVLEAFIHQRGTFNLESWDAKYVKKERTKFSKMLYGR